MNEERKDKPTAIIAGLFHDAVGLPPGDGTAHGKGKPVEDTKAPHGGLTSDDPARRDGAPVNRNSGTDE
jgi:hypothetical protein